MCGFSEKCGDIQTFESAELAALSNYTIAHCGPCGYCSKWNDLPLQLVSRQYLLSSTSVECSCSHYFFVLMKLQMDLATPGRNCGMQNFMKSGESKFKATQECIMKEIGFTEDCAWAWTKSVQCSQKSVALISANFS